MEGVSIDGSLLSNYGSRLWENDEFGPGMALPPQRVVRLWERTVGVRKGIPEPSDIRRRSSAEDQSGSGKGAVEGEVGRAQDKYILRKFKSVWKTELLSNLRALHPIPAIRGPHDPVGLHGLGRPISVIAPGAIYRRIDRNAMKIQSQQLWRPVLWT